MKKLLLGLISIGLFTIGQNANAGFWNKVTSALSGEDYDVYAWNPTGFIVRGTTIHTGGACQKSDTSDILPGQVKKRTIGACTSVYIESDHVEYILQQCAHGTSAYNQNLGLGGGGSTTGGTTVVVVQTGGQTGNQPQQTGNTQGVVNIPVGTSKTFSMPPIGISTGAGQIWFALAMKLYDENGNCLANPTAQWVHLMDKPQLNPGKY